MTEPGVQSLRIQTDHNEAKAHCLHHLIEDMHFKASHYGLTSGVLNASRKSDLKAMIPSAVLKPDPIAYLFDWVKRNQLGRSSHDSHAWETVETTINARLSLGLVGTKSATIGAEMNRHLGAVNAPSELLLADADWKGTADYRFFGQPDLILVGQNGGRISHILLGELKVRGGKSRAQFSPEQFLKYRRYAKALSNEYPSAEISIVLWGSEPTVKGFLERNSKCKWIRNTNAESGEVLEADLLMAKQLSRRKDLTTDRFGTVAHPEASLFYLNVCEFVDGILDDADDFSKTQFMAVRRFAPRASKGKIASEGPTLNIT